jgi:hypothetical protein
VFSHILRTGLSARRSVWRCCGDSVATERVAEASTKIIFESRVAGGVDKWIDTTIDIDSDDRRAEQGAIPIYIDIEHLRGHVYTLIGSPANHVSYCDQ